MMEEPETNLPTSSPCDNLEKEPENPTTVAAEVSVPEKNQSEPSSPAHDVKNKTKIDVLLKAAGDAPIMKKKRWSVERTKTVAKIIEFIHKYLKLETAESLFLYVNQAFAPSPDVEIGKLFDCFETDGKLIMYYCRSQAWG